ncbi:MAG: phosphonate metabolism transcriptional regulator PhnF [Alphaproteobacteria bacterium]|nr:phosphonate metabolism transcriptional regulator PhnF [Alphaproteobacteria bacterium]
MVGIEQEPGVAVWRQISQTLHSDISSGGYQPGEKMPTEVMLSRRFGVNRHTVRRAISDLVDQGLVRVEQGRGTFVAEDVVEFVVGERTRFTELMTTQQRTPGTRLIRAIELPAEEMIAVNLKLRIGTKVVLIERLGEADGRAISIGSHYFPARRVPGLIAAFEERSSITKALSDIGISDYVRLSTRVRSRQATSEEAKLLKISLATPVLETLSINCDSNGKRIEFGVSRFASNRVELRFDT